jgi:mRNA interferase MazF
MAIKQYKIVLVNLNGSDIKKTRPCVIISPNEMNKYLNTVIIAPVTSQSKNYPTRVLFKHNNRQSWIVLDQIRTIDKQRIVKIVDSLQEKEIEEVKLIIKEMFVD